MFGGKNRELDPLDPKNEGGDPRDAGSEESAFFERSPELKKGLIASGVFGGFAPKVQEFDSQTHRASTDGRTFFHVRDMEGNLKLALEKDGSGVIVDSTEYRTKK